jgi:hypothetical protein
LLLARVLRHAALHNSRLDGRILGQLGPIGHDLAAAAFKPIDRTRHARPTGGFNSHLPDLSLGIPRNGFTSHAAVHHAAIMGGVVIRYAGAAMYVLRLGIRHIIIVVVVVVKVPDRHVGVMMPAQAKIKAEGHV